MPFPRSDSKHRSYFHARLLAKSVLAKNEFVLQLWKSRTKYTPLVYELLLAMYKRLFSTHP